MGHKQKDPVKVASVTFTTALIYEGSWGERDAGKHESTMEFWVMGNGRGYIEWDIPGLDDSECIGLWWDCDTMELEDYDGIMGFPPEQAVKLMTDYGIKVGPDFRPEGDSDASS